jgi:hypothetical protein
MDQFIRHPAQLGSRISKSAPEPREVKAAKDINIRFVDNAVDKRSRTCITEKFPLNASDPLGRGKLDNPTFEDFDKPEIIPPDPSIDEWLTRNLSGRGIWDWYLEMCTKDLLSELQRPAPKKKKHNSGMRFKLQMK